VRLFLSSILMNFVTFTDYGLDQPFLRDDLSAKVGPYLLLRIEHLDIFAL